MYNENHWQAYRIVDAFNFLDSKTLIEVTAAFDYVRQQDAIAEWLRVERNWKSSVKNWLAAEARWTAKQGIDGKHYQAAKAGWERIKSYVPNLDGVSRFEDLAEAVQFRYAVFAAEVNGWDQPSEVKSRKQLLQEGGE